MPLLIRSHVTHKLHKMTQETDEKLHNDSSSHVLKKQLHMKTTRFSALFYFGHTNAPRRSKIYFSYKHFQLYIEAISPLIVQKHSNNPVLSHKNWLSNPQRLF